MEIKEKLRITLKTKENYQIALERILEMIKVLEGIYQTGNFVFSNEFKASALRERNNLCLESSALYSLLREAEQTRF